MAKRRPARHRWQGAGAGRSARRNPGRPVAAGRATGPAFLVFRNYDAIYAYNAAESYALSI
ncbi:lytic murein transglycosylase, partial [Xanthomonas arboricola]|uniref:lytic murein transglycosylase n=1 Tax=Xanthomonas arboricola TaxID=56448 RepID=UPI003CCF5A8B